MQVTQHKSHFHDTDIPGNKRETKFPTTHPIRIDARRVSIIGHISVSSLELVSSSTTNTNKDNGKNAYHPETGLC